MKTFFALLFAIALVPAVFAVDVPITIEVLNESVRLTCGSEVNVFPTTAVANYDFGCAAPDNLTVFNSSSFNVSIDYDAIRNSLSNVSCSDVSVDLEPFRTAVSDFKGQVVGSVEGESAKILSSISEFRECDGELQNVQSAYSRLQGDYGVVIGQLNGSSMALESERQNGFILKVSALVLFFLVLAMSALMIGQRGWFGEWAASRNKIDHNKKEGQ